MTEEVHHRRGGGRAARQTTRNTSNAQREAFLTRLIKPYELVSDEGLELLEQNADTILDEIGVEFEEPPRDEPYGRVAVFRDLFGNRWDLVETIRRLT